MPTIREVKTELRNRQPDQRAKKMSRDQPRLKSRIRFITMNCSE